MAIAIRGGSPATAFSTTATVSVTLTGTRQPQSGDVLCIIHCNDFYTLGAMPTPTVGGSTSGVTAITGTGLPADGGSNFAHAKPYYYIVGSAGDLTVSETETGSADEEKGIAVYVLSGVDTGTPIDTAAGAFDSTNTSTTAHICPSVSPSSSDAFLVCHVNDGGGADSGPVTAYPSGMSSAYDVDAGGMSFAGATQQLSSSGATGTKTFTETLTQRNYTALTIAFKTAAAAASIPYSPQRTVIARDSGEVQWLQRDRRNANLVATAANDLAPPLLQPIEPRYDITTRLRSAWPQQRSYSDPSLLNPAVAMSPPAAQRYVPPRDYGEAQWLQLARRDPALLTTALLENELLGGRRANVPATHADRREVPQQRIYFDISLLATALLEGPLLWTRPPQAMTDRRATISQPRGFDPSLLAPIATDVPLADIWRRLLPATHVDRRMAPAQPQRETLYFDAGPDSPPLTLAWGAGGSLWHRYNPRWPARWWPVLQTFAAISDALVPGVLTPSNSGPSLRATSATSTTARSATSSLSATTGP